MTVTGSSLPSASSPPRTVPTGAPFQQPNTTDRFNQGYVNGYNGSASPNELGAFGVDQSLVDQLDNQVMTGLLIFSSPMALPSLVEGGAVGSAYARTYLNNRALREAFWQLGNHFGGGLTERPNGTGIPNPANPTELPPAIYLQVD